MGMIPRNRIILNKQTGSRPPGNNFSGRHSVILWFTKSDDYVFHLDDSYRAQERNQGDVWDFNGVTHNHEEQTTLACQFPEDMTTRIVLTTTNEGGVVVDPYMGAGTVAIVARIVKGLSGGGDRPAYHSVALRRLSGEPDTRGYFPNLKTLRNYVRERTGEPEERFKVDMYRGSGQ